MRWRAVLYHGTKKQALVSSPTKENAISLILHYAKMYANEDFKTMKIKVYQIGDKDVD